MAVALEGDVTEVEMGRFVVSSSVAVFAGMHEEEESDPDDVCNALYFCVPDDVVQDSVGEQFDLVWWRVLSCVAT